MGRIREEWTDAKVKALRLSADVSERRVSIEKSLYLRLRRGSGTEGKPGKVTKHWEYRTKVSRQTRWLALGEYPGVSLAQARRDVAGHQARADKARRGEGDHPALEARVERRRSLAEPTLREVAEEWLALSDLRESTKMLHRGNLEADVFPRIGDGRIQHLSDNSYRDCIDAAVRRGARGQAAQIYKTLRTLLNFARKSRGYLNSDPLANVTNPKPYNPRKITPRAANDRELRVFLELVAASEISAPIKQALALQLLTGARPGEVRGARWEEISEPLRQWCIPAERVKTGKAFNIHLSAQALAVLAQAKAIDSPKGYVFTGRDDGMISKLATARALARLSAALKEQSVERLRPHDLRRTFRTILSRIDIPPHIAERCLNHADANPLDTVYNAHDYRPQMIEAWDRAGAHVEAVRFGAANVLPFKKSA